MRVAPLWGTTLSEDFREALASLYRAGHGGGGMHHRRLQVGLFWSSRLGPPAEGIHREPAPPRDAAPGPGPRRSVARRRGAGGQRHLLPRRAGDPRTKRRGDLLVEPHDLPGRPTPGTTGPGSGDGSLIGYFLNNLGGSPYYNINTTYTDGAGVPIQNSVTYTEFWAANDNVPLPLVPVTDLQMQNQIIEGFTTGKLTYDPNTLYLVFSDALVNWAGLLASCTAPTTATSTGAARM